MAVSARLSDRLLGGRYRLGELLGRGGMAEVYDGFDERLDRPVAVKVLRPEMAARDDVRRRFEDEARAAARLSHPNVVSVFDSGEDGVVPFLVMERLPGETMADRMAAAGAALDTDWVLRVAGDVLLALGAAHDAGLVHRDVKPGNVLLGSDGCAKVADFGIAKSLEMAGDLTSTNQLLGTPAYVAPERIEGQAATVQADLYAVGVLLYEALAGVKPFTGETPVSVAYAIRHATPEPLTSLRPDLPTSLVAAVERAMARAPEDRFGSATDMAAALGVSPAGAGAVAAGSHDETVLSAPTTTAAVDATSVLPVQTTAPRADGASRHDVRPWPRFVTERGRGLLQDRRRLRVVAIGGVVLALLLVGLAAAAGGGDEPSVSPAREALADDLRSAADDLSPSDGPAAGDAAEAAEALAGKVDDGAGADEASALLRQLVAWRDGGGLTTAAADELAGLARRVPGVDGDAYTAPPTTTAAPPPTEPPRAGGDDDDDGEGRARGKKKKDD